MYKCIDGYLWFPIIKCYEIWKVKFGIQSGLSHNIGYCIVKREHARHSWVFHQVFSQYSKSNFFFARENRIERKWYNHAIWNVTKLFENNNCIIIVDSEKGGERLYDYPELCLSLFCWFDSISEFVRL